MRNKRALVMALVVTATACGVSNLQTASTKSQREDRAPKAGNVDCPDASHGSKCAAAADKTCSGAMHFEAGHGCVANVVTPPLPASATTPVPASATPPPAPTLATDSMIPIPAGSFMMGSYDGPSEEMPVHRVSVSAFEMDATEVTVGAYRACVNAGKCTRPTAITQCNWEGAGKEDHPINCVNWHQATAYCAAVGKRLPTEEEWEYGARGSSSRKYPWGAAAPVGQLCWNRESGTCVVGSYPSGDSPFGLHDMAGNVWEWTSSGYSKDYRKKRVDSRRVRKGGSWAGHYPEVQRGAHRLPEDPLFRDYHLGFRCARSLPTASPLPEPAHQLLALAQDVEEFPASER